MFKFILSLIVLFSASGWVMNLQNLWQYWPETNKIGDLGFEWVISFIGIFVAPIGVFTGWIY